MVGRKHSLHILGNLITGTSPIVYLHGVRVREREREREGEGEGKRERVGEKEVERHGGGVKYQNTSEVLATAQLLVYARGFQLVSSPAWHARLVFSFDVSCFNTGSSSDVHW